MDWRVILPLKPSGIAKSRLRDATESSVRHAQLVRAIQLDTLGAILATPASISGVLVVGSGSIFGDGLPAGVEVLPDPDTGLNDAISTAARQVNDHHPQDGLIVMVADLPALRPADLAGLLQAAEQHPRGVVPDAAGTGTTMLTARPGQTLVPEFGVDSAARHRAGGAVELIAPAGARTDVDTAEDLRRCLQLGVGVHTARMVAYLV